MDKGMWQNVQGEELERNHAIIKHAIQNGMNDPQLKRYSEMSSTELLSLCDSQDTGEEELIVSIGAVDAEQYLQSIAPQGYIVGENFGGYGLWRLEEYGL